MSDETTPAPRIRNGGALWCDEHQRWECVKNRKQARGGGRCHMPAITGLPRCRLHAGVTVELAEVQGEAMDAWSATYGQTAVDPAQAVIGMLNMAVFRANFYASLLEEQVLAAQEDRAELDAEEAGLPRAKGAPPVGEGAASSATPTPPTRNTASSPAVRPSAASSSSKARSATASSSTPRPRTTWASLSATSASPSSRPSSSRAPSARSSTA